MQRRPTKFGVQKVTIDDEKAAVLFTRTIDEVKEVWERGSICKAKRKFDFN